MTRGERWQRTQRRAWFAGYYTRLGGGPVGACPYPEGKLATTWLVGYDFADQKADHRL